MPVPKGPHLEFEQPVVELAMKIEDLLKTGGVTDADVRSLQAKKEALQKKIAAKLSPWNRIELARRAGRPFTLDYVKSIFTDFVELHGDRAFGDDPAMIAGLARLDGQSVAIVGQQKGRDTKESIRRNFGMANPEGYRKALRVMKLAERFGLPVISFIDTPGAFPGLGAEERGQGEAIAVNLMEMAVLRTPILAVVIGEGASGGALGIGVGDRVIMLENAWYSVISPENCSTILWRSWDQKARAAEAMKLTASDMLGQGLIDGIIQEPVGGAHANWDEMFANVKGEILKQISILKPMDANVRVSKRIDKFCKMGVVIE